VSGKPAVERTALRSERVHASEPERIALRIERVHASELERLALCLEIRREVFVRGQGVCEAEEIDGLDAACRHYLAWSGTEPVGTARLRSTPAGAKAERVAVRAPWRGVGVGAALMRELEEDARRAGRAQVVLNAQLAALAFYERLGYVAEGDVFDEAGIPHRRMRRALAGPKAPGARLRS